jgi:hypothetical protein
MAFILGVAIAISFVLLPLSAYPGILPELGFYASVCSPLWLPAVCISLRAFVDIAHESRDITRRPSGRRWRLATAALVLVVNCVLLWCGARLRLAFLHARPAFEACVATAQGAYARGERFNQRLGMYHVEASRADSASRADFRALFGSRDAPRAAGTSL